MINRVVLVGRLTKEAEIKSYQTSNGISCLARFTLAVNRDKDNTDFIPCTAFGKTAEIIEKYTNKGSQIAVDGMLKQNRWTTQSGESRSALDVNVQKVALLSSRNDSKQQNNSNVNDYIDNRKSTENQANEDDLMYDELPF